MVNDLLLLVLCIELLALLYFRMCRKDETPSKLKKRTRIIAGNTAAIPLIGAILLHRRAWRVTEWVEDRASALSERHYRADRKVYDACMRLENWTYSSEKGS